MSGNFSTIGPMSQSTISRPPAFTTATAQQPQASSPMDSYGQPKPKKSHWFRNTLLTAVVLAAGAAVGARYLPNTFNPAAKLAGNENIMQKGLHFVKLGVAKAGEFVNKYAEQAYNWAKNLISKKTPGTGGTP